MALFFFLAIATFWVVKPLKRGLLLGFYQGRTLEIGAWTFQAAQAEQLAKVLNMAAAFVAVVVFTALVRRLQRHQLVVLICAVFLAGFFAFALLVRSPTAPVVWSFYVFGDLFNTVLVAVFWAFMNDLTDGNQAKRLYGLVGLGGVLGGLVGATVVQQSVVGVGRSPLLFGCMIPIAAIAGIAVHVHRNVQEAAEVTPAAGSKANIVSEGARLVFGSRYLLGIATLILLYEMVSNIVDFQLSAVVQRTILGAREKDQFFASIGQLSGLASIGVQLLATSLVMRRLGMSAALLVLPIALAGGATGFLFVPTIALAAWMSVSDNALNYSINQSSKEALYVPTSRDEKYKAKAFIDMFVQRSAKVMAVALNLVVSAAVGMANVAWLSLASLSLLLLWIPTAWYLGRRFEHRVDERERAEATLSRPSTVPVVVSGRYDAPSPS